VYRAACDSLSSARRARTARNVTRARRDSGLLVAHIQRTTVRSNSTWTIPPPTCPTNPTTCA